MVWEQAILMVEMGSKKLARPFTKWENKLGTDFIFTFRIYYSL